MLALLRVFKVISVMLSLFLVAVQKLEWETVDKKCTLRDAWMRAQSGTV
ncbi:MAG: hypothetical protein PHS86_05105 [Syntrophaceae bacterium]|nr:hypothetical protein [Syntrophaceae bacterium]